MRRLLLGFCVAFSPACGSNPAAPDPTVFQLSAGAYRLQFGGANCFVISAGGSAGVGTSFEAIVTLNASGAEWVIPAASSTLHGTVKSDGRTVTAQLGGYFDFGSTRFIPGPNAADTMSISGFAAAADRFEGSVLSGQPMFFTLSENGGSVATCQSGTFVLRRAT